MVFVVVVGIVVVGVVADFVNGCLQYLGSNVPEITVVVDVERRCRRG